MVTYQAGFSTTELLAARIRQLEKKPEDLARAAEVLKQNRLRSKAQFEKRFMARLCKDHYEPGTLVLVRNVAVEKEMNRKSKPQYLGPYEVVRQTRNGAYILQEIDGTLLKQKVAAFRVVPYISRSNRQQLRLLAPELDEIDRGDQESSENEDA